MFIYISKIKLNKQPQLIGVRTLCWRDRAIGDFSVRRPRFTPRSTHAKSVRSRNGTGFPPSPSAFPCQYHCTTAPHSPIHHHEDEQCPLKTQPYRHRQSQPTGTKQSPGKKIHTFILQESAEIATITSCPLRKTAAPAGLAENVPQTRPCVFSCHRAVTRNLAPKHVTIIPSCDSSRWTGNQCCDRQDYIPECARMSDAHERPQVLEKQTQLDTSRNCAKICFVSPALSYTRS